ncbi:bifunctional hydroxymethylpyrimidine kinase/phosphomethylpyrimidine kinase [Bacillus cereus]
MGTHKAGTGKAQGKAGTRQRSTRQGGQGRRGGCRYKVGKAAGLAKGYSMEEAVQEAKRFISIAIEEPLHIGSGHGPTNHFAYKMNKAQV